MTNMTESKLSIFSHPGKITVFGLLQDHFHIEAHIGPGQYGPRLRLRPILDLDSVSGQYGGLGMLTRPIWKCPCINL